MPRIFDNIALELLPALRDTLQISHRSDFCVGYFNLRGWKAIDGLIEQWPGGEGAQCRLLVGMQRLASDELRLAYSLLPQEDQISQQAVIRLKRRLAEEFRAQLTFGAPTDEDEAGLRRLSAQLKAGKVIVKLFLRHTLHAKLYLCFRTDCNNPITGFLGSSNLTLAGLSNQGELNVDVLDQDATKKLEQWFNDRWTDRWCVDITKELIQVIDESWARPACPPPYHIYVKMAYHLAEEARAGLSEFSIPPDMRDGLLEFQSAAVRIAARHLEKRRGVMLGDVVGLGKTLMATALARVFQDPPRSLETLILCPKNLVSMWEDYAHRYRLRAYDQAAQWRDTGRCVISGFHSPVERECLRILLRGSQPIILSPARSIPTRPPPEWRAPISEGRLLLLSFFKDGPHRPTTETAQRRNTLVAALANEVYIPHASPGGHLQSLLQVINLWAVPVITQPPNPETVMSPR